MQLLNRMDKKTRLSFLDSIPELIHQNYNEPATLKQGEKTWNSTCIGCVNPKCMFYYDDEDICDEIIEILSNQTYRVMLLRYLSPKDLEEIGVSDTYIKYIATKSGALGDEGKEDMINCRNDGGIFSTEDGSYIISIFISGMKDRGFYPDNPAILLGGKISKVVLKTFKENNGEI